MEDLSVLNFALKLISSQLSLDMKGWIERDGKGFEKTISWPSQQLGASPECKILEPHTSRQIVIVDTNRVYLIGFGLKKLNFIQFQSSASNSTLVLL